MTTTDTAHFKPEPYEVLRKKLPKALSLIYDVDELLKLPPKARPTAQREHIFDFLEGIRMLVTIDHDVTTKPAELVHVSFSFNPASFKTLKAFERRIQGIMDDMFPQDRVLLRRDMSDSAVHFGYEIAAFARHFQVNPIHVSKPTP